MSSLQLWKIWKISETLLQRARFVMPEASESSKEEFNKLDNNKLDKQFAEMLEHNEHELALDILEEMGLIAQPKGEFWRDLERAAVNMGLNDRVPAIRFEFDKALARIPKAEQSGGNNFDALRALFWATERASPEMKSDPAADMWVLFYTGDRQSLAAQQCPRCGGTLLWSPYIHDKPRQLGGETRYPMGLSIYCRGACNYMLGHLDGLAPAWALGVTDWNAFNHELQSTNVA